MARHRGRENKRKAKQLARALEASSGNTKEEASNNKEISNDTEDVSRDKTENSNHEEEIESQNRDYRVEVSQNGEYRVKVREERKRRKEAKRQVQIREEEEQLEKKRIEEAERQKKMRIRQTRELDQVLPEEMTSGEPYVAEQDIKVMSQEVIRLWVVEESQRAREWTSCSQEFQKAKYRFKNAELSWKRNKGNYLRGLEIYVPEYVDSDEIESPILNKTLYSVLRDEGVSWEEKLMSKIDMSEIATIVTSNPSIG